MGQRNSSNNESSNWIQWILTYSEAKKNNTKNESPNWKQWIPIYGIYQIVRDDMKGKPSIAKYIVENPKIFLASTVYQGASTALLICGLESFLN